MVLLWNRLIGLLGRSLHLISTWGQAFEEVVVTCLVTELVNYTERGKPFEMINISVVNPSCCFIPCFDICISLLWLFNLIKCVDLIKLLFVLFHPHIYSLLYIINRCVSLFHLSFMLSVCTMGEFACLLGFGNQVITYNIVDVGLRLIRLTISVGICVVIG